MNQEGQWQLGSVSLSSHISISGTGCGVSTWLEKRDQSKPYLAPSTEINFRPRREKETVFGAAWLHFLPQWAPRPQRDTKTDLHATRYSLLPAANLLLWQVSFPNSNLEDFSNLNGICGRSGDTLKTHTRTHTHFLFFSFSLLHTRTHTHKEEGKLHQIVIMEIRIQLSAAPNTKWCPWWSVGLFQKQRIGHQLFTQSLLLLLLMLKWVRSSPWLSRLRHIPYMYL